MLVDYKSNLPIGDLVVISMAYEETPECEAFECMLDCIRGHRQLAGATPMRMVVVDDLSFVGVRGVVVIIAMILVVVRLP